MSLDNKLYSYLVVVSNHSSETEEVIVYPLEFAYNFFQKVFFYLAVNFESYFTRHKFALSLLHFLFFLW